MTDPRFTAAFWDERYSAPTQVWSGNPNPALVEQATDLKPGTALEAGCGEGADAIWLAAQGWQVTGVDFSARALTRAAEHAPGHLADSLSWQEADVRTWAAAHDGDEPRYELVTASFLHFPSTVRRAVFAALAARVTPGGTLLLIGHHPSDMTTAMPRPPEPDLFYTAEDLATDLPQSQWTIHTRSARPRQAPNPDGQPVTIHDTVLRAQRN